MEGLNGEASLVRDALIPITGLPTNWTRNGNYTGVVLMGRRSEKQISSNERPSTLPGTAYLSPNLRSVLVWIRKPSMTARE
jgi:hypothetical protein